MANGWVKLHRELLNNPIFANEKLLKVFIWCISKATHEEYKQLVGKQIVYLLPGQFVTGRKAASEELDLKQSTAWDYLKLLETNSTIDIKSNSKFSVITIINWGFYQMNEAISDNKTDSKPDIKPTANRHKQEHKNIENKEIERDREIGGEIGRVDKYSPEVRNFLSNLSKGSQKNQENI